MLRRLTALALVIAASAVFATVAHGAIKSWASWYGPGLYGNHLACGGRLTTSTWGVANKTLPCGTRITICYSRCVSARVIDRGPYVAGRELDLTYPVRRAIGMPGVGLVRWWVTGH